MGKRPDGVADYWAPRNTKTIDGCLTGIGANLGKPTP